MRLKVTIGISRCLRGTPNSHANSRPPPSSSCTVRTLSTLTGNALQRTMLLEDREDPSLVLFLLLRWCGSRLSVIIRSGRVKREEEGRAWSSRLVRRRSISVKTGPGKHDIEGATHTRTGARGPAVEILTRFTRLRVRVTYHTVDISSSHNGTRSLSSRPIPS